MWQVYTHEHKHTHTHTHSQQKGKNVLMGPEYSSVVKNVFRIHKILGSIQSTEWKGQGPIKTPDKMPKSLADNAYYSS